MMDTKNIVRSLWEPITTFQILLLFEFWAYLNLDVYQIHPNALTIYVYIL